MNNDKIEINEEMLNKIKTLEEGSEAYIALSLVSKILNSISSGSQIDPSFILRLKNEIEGGIKSEPKEKRIIKKKKRLNNAEQE